MTLESGSSAHGFENNNFFLATPRNGNQVEGGEPFASLTNPNFYHAHATTRNIPNAPSAADLHLQ